jgi:hypothetical protein
MFNLTKSCRNHKEGRVQWTFDEFRHSHFADGSIVSLGPIA